MHNRHQILAALGLTLGLHTAATAGGEAAPAPAPAPAGNPGNWCEWLQNKPGQLYKNAENPIIQSFQIGGRFQYQAAYLDGEDVNGRDFHDTYDEYRRVRVETKTEFLKFFSAKVGINIVEDGRRKGEDLDWGYQSFDEAYLTFDIGKAFGAGPFDSLKLNAGRIKFLMTEEARMSSKDIITIERSAISNKLYNSGRPTGVTLDAASGPWTATLGVFSALEDDEFIDEWNQGTAFYLGAGYKASDALTFTADYVYNDEPGGFTGYKWASSFNAIYDQDRFGILGTLAVGENAEAAPRDDNFVGFVAMPWYWIVPEKLQFVAQYNYSGSEAAEGIRANSRYLASSHDNALVDVNSGRGDELHTFYAGLNYYLCGHNAKIMGGIEYADLDTPKGNTDALTYSIAFRGFF